MWRIQPSFDTEQLGTAHRDVLLDGLKIDRHPPHIAGYNGNKTATAVKSQ